MSDGRIACRASRRNLILDRGRGRQAKWLAGTAGHVVAFDGRRHAGLRRPRKQAPWHAGPHQAAAWLAGLPGAGAPVPVPW